MRTLFEGWHIVVLLIVVILIFGTAKLPQLAKSIGQSMKILKSEVKDLRDDPARGGGEVPPSGEATPKA